MGRKKLNRERRVIYCETQLSNSEIVDLVEGYDGGSLTVMVKEIHSAVLGGVIPSVLEDSTPEPEKVSYLPSKEEISGLDDVYGKVEYDPAFSRAVDELFLRYSRYSKDSDKAFFLKRVGNIK